MVKVLFFSSLSDRAGARMANLDLPDSIRVADLKVYIERAYPGIAPHMKTVLVAINHEFALDEDLVPGGAEVALFPPVSGG